MRYQPCQPQSRHGVAAVEFALVAIPLFLTLFGIYEFGRFIMVRQVLEHAAREGARYAAVNTFSTNVASETETFVRERLSGVDVSAFGAQATVRVFAADNTGTPLTPDDSPQNAPFGTYIGVNITGQYQTMLPNILGMPDQIPMETQALMNSEAN